MKKESGPAHDAIRVLSENSRKAIYSSYEVMEMIGERLQEVRKDHGDTQKDLAAKLDVVFHTVSSWEQGKSEACHDLLVKICQLYHVSADYLLGISDIDPAYVQRRRLEQFTPEELSSLKDVEQFLLWKRKNNAENRQE